MTPRILVVEPDPSLAHMLQCQLLAAGFEILQAANGDMAWQLIQMHSPDLVLMEAGSPGLSSQEIICRMRTHVQLAQVRVILLGDPTTGYELAWWIECGADDYISKPFSIRVLIAQIRAMLRRASMNRVSKPEGCRG